MTITSVASAAETTVVAAATTVADGRLEGRPDHFAAAACKPRGSVQVVSPMIVLEGAILEEVAASASR